LRHFLCSSLFLIACSTSEGDTTIDITHDPCSGVRLIGDSSASQRAAIDAALALWAEQGVDLAGGANRASPSSIEIVFEEAYAAFRGLYDDERGIIVINSTLTDPQSLSIVIAHELGHAFGLEHVTDRPSLMNPANLTTPPTADDLVAVEALWGQCN
jgi:predicted Zn-dependent protease